MFKKLIFTIFSTLLLVSFSVSATTEDLNYLDAVGAAYYDPLADDCLDLLTNTAQPYSFYTGDTSSGLTPLQAGWVERWHDTAAALSIEYGIPWEAVMSQSIFEGTAGTSNFAVNRNNFFGLGAVDSNPELAYSYPTPEAGWRGYYEFINNNPRYRNHGAFNTPDDPYQYIAAIKAAGYATSPTYINTANNYIQKIIAYAREKGWETSAELVRSHPEMITNAERNAAGNTSSVTAASSRQFTELCLNNKFLTASENATLEEVTGSNNINQTAIALSWADRSHSVDDPRPTYKAALEKANLTTHSDHNVRRGSSCDAFVATVLRVSGADPEVVCCGAGNMLNYFASHPEKYQEIPNLGNTSNLQPGDIRIDPTHVEIFVVINGTSGRIASASYGGRTADHASNFYQKTSFRIFRRTL